MKNNIVINRGIFHKTSAFRELIKCILAEQNEIHNCKGEI